MIIMNDKKIHKLNYKSLSLIIYIYFLNLSKLSKFSIENITMNDLTKLKYLKICFYVLSMWILIITVVLLILLDKL